MNGYGFRKDRSVFWTVMLIALVLVAASTAAMYWADVLNTLGIR